MKEALCQFEVFSHLYTVSGMLRTLVCQVERGAAETQECPLFGPLALLPSHVHFERCGKGRHGAEESRHSGPQRKTLTGEAHGGLIDVCERAHPHARIRLYRYETLRRVETEGISVAQSEIR